MSTDTSDISMLQLADSFFPTGMYTTSNGIEALFYSGRKLKPPELRDLVKMCIESQIGPADCVAVGNTYELAAKGDIEGVIKIDQMLYCMKLVQEIRDASARSGTQMLRCVNSFIEENKVLTEYVSAIKKGEAHGPYPVALAVASNALTMSKRKAGIAMLYSFSVGMVGAALRLGMFQHFDGQRIIDELKPVITSTVDLYIDRPIDGLWQFAPQMDIIQIMHEQMDSKMFIT